MQKYDLLIVGAGPAGLEAALQANKIGIKFLLIDRLEAGSLIFNTMAQKKFYHSYGRNTGAPTGLLDFPDRLLGKELVERWKNQANTLNYKPFTALLGMKKSDNLYECQLTNETISTEKIIIASGTHENPKHLDIPGEKDNPKVFYSLDYGDIPIDEQIVVVGGGNTAIESALECALDNDVALIIRKGEIRDSVTEKNRKELEEEIEHGTITPYWNSNLTKVDDEELTIKTPGGEKNLPYSHLYIHIGFESPKAWLDELGIATDASRGDLPNLTENFETNLKGVYIIGSLTGADSVVESANQAIKVVKNF